MYDIHMLYMYYEYSVDIRHWIPEYSLPSTIHIHWLIFIPSPGVPSSRARPGSDGKLFMLYVLKPMLYIQARVKAIDPSAPPARYIESV